MLTEEARNLALAAAWKGLAEHPTSSATVVAEGVVAGLSTEEKEGVCVLAIVKIIGAIEQTRQNVANLL